jgi:hypothetical protein
MGPFDAKSSSDMAALSSFKRRLLTIEVGLGICLTEYSKIEADLQKIKQRSFRFASFIDKWVGRLTLAEIIKEVIAGDPAVSLIEELIQVGLLIV